MSSTRCPLCGGRWDLGTAWTHPRERCKCEKDDIDHLLEVGAAFDWITPTFEIMRDILGWLKKK